VGDLDIVKRQLQAVSDREIAAVVARPISVVIAPIIRNCFRYSGADERLATSRSRSARTRSWSIGFLLSVGRGEWVPIGPGRVRPG
jgi:hypothetical protein